MKGLIVTADDFGAATEVNEAVEQGHLGGILTAASLMVSAPAAADAVARARQLPRLRVGLHLVLVDGRPTLPAASLPDLVDATGNFRDDMARSAASMFFFPSVRRQLEAEIAAQFDAFRATGLPLDHVNTHKHFHLHPTIAVLRRAESGVKLRGAYITAPWAALSRARFRAAGLRVPDQVFGLAWSGAMTPARVLGLIENLPDGLTELYLHPATGPYAGSAPGYRYAEELAALLAPRTVEASRNSAIAKGGFADF
jgi:chitin disaccharide deacetylase